MVDLASACLPCPPPAPLQSAPQTHWPPGSFRTSAHWAWTRPSSPLCLSSDPHALNLEASLNHPSSGKPPCASVSSQFTVCLIEPHCFSRTYQFVLLCWLVQRSLLECKPWANRLHIYLYLSLTPSAQHSSWHGVGALLVLERMNGLTLERRGWTWRLGQQ